MPTVDATTNAGTATMSAVIAASATVVAVTMTVTATVAIVTVVTVATVTVATVTVTTVAATGPDPARARPVDAGTTTTATAAGTVMEDAPRTETETPGVEPPAALRPPRATTVSARGAHAAPAALAVIERTTRKGKRSFTNAEKKTKGNVNNH